MCQGSKTEKCEQQKEVDAHDECLRRAGGSEAGIGQGYGQSSCEHGVCAGRIVQCCTGNCERWRPAQGVG